MSASVSAPASDFSGVCTVPTPGAAAPSHLPPRDPRRMDQGRDRPLDLLDDRRRIALTVLLFAGGILFVVTLAPASEVPDPTAVLADNYGPVPSLGVMGFAFMFAYALVAILGVLVVGPERSTGLLAATLAVVPRRTPVFAREGALSAAIGAAVGLVGAVASFFLVQSQLAPLGLGSTLADPEVLQVLAGGAVFLALIAMLRPRSARSSAAPLRPWAPCSALLLVAPMILPLMPGIGGELAGWLPSSAGMMLFQSAAQSRLAADPHGRTRPPRVEVGSVALGGARFARRDV